MTWVSEIASTNQQWQWGPETTPGTAVPAGKLLKCFDIVPGINAGSTPYRPTGNKYDSLEEEDWEESGLTLNGILDYNGLSYLLSSVAGKITPVLNGSSATAYKWGVTPPITGSTQPQTYTMMQGDSVRARSLAYGVFNTFGYKWTPKTSPMVSAAGFGLPLADGIALTSSPTAVALAASADVQFNFFLDTASANIGTTALTRLFSSDYSFGNVYGPFYASNRPTVGMSGHVDLGPKTTIKLLMGADSTGLAAMQSYLKSKQLIYLRVQATGAVIDNLQIAAITGAPTGGTFTLTYKSQTTAGIAFNATAAAVQSALIALSSVGAGNVTVSGSAGGPYNVVFGGTLSQDLTVLTASGAGLTGGTSPSVTITQSQSHNQFTHDMALRVSKGNPLKDDQGIFAAEWECTISQDPAWNGGQAQVFTVVNLLASL